MWHAIYAAAPAAVRGLTVGGARHAGVGVCRVVAPVRALVAVEGVQAGRAALVALTALDAGQVVGPPETPGRPGR